jgi:hypothetical protein
MFFPDEEALKVHTQRLRFFLMLMVHMTNQDNPPKGD